MFDEIRDFVVKNKIWFIIGGIICAMFGAVMAALISLYFLIAVAVGLIIAVVSGLVKNNDKLHDQDKSAPPISTPTPDNKELEEYKKEARKRITKEYVKELLKSVEKGKEINESEDMCSSLFKENGFGPRGDGDAFNIIKTHFDQIKIGDISKNFETAIRGDIEVLFEILTGVEWSKAEHMSGNVYDLANQLCFEAQGQGCHDFSKCFFEHTILCACALYGNRNLLKLYTNEKLTKEQEERERPLLQFSDWDDNHKHGSVL